MTEAVETFLLFVTMALAVAGVAYFVAIGFDVWRH